MRNRFVLTPYFLDEDRPALEELADADWEINRPPLAAGQPLERMAALYEPLAQWVAATIARGDRPVSVANDCCAAVGVLAGLQRGGLEPTLIWFDAHGDFNTWETSPSGFLGGMPLAMLVGRGDPTIVRALGITPLPEDRVILTGARDLDPGEKASLEGSAVVRLPEVEALFSHPLPQRPIYVHLDVDVVDPDELPAVGYPAPGGPAVATVRRVFRFLAHTGSVRAASVSTWNPHQDEDGTSRRVAMGLMEDLLE